MFSRKALLSIYRLDNDFMRMLLYMCTKINRPKAKYTFQLWIVDNCSMKDLLIWWIKAVWNNELALICKHLVPLLWFMDANKGFHTSDRMYIYIIFKMFLETSLWILRWPLTKYVFWDNMVWLTSGMKSNVLTYICCSIHFREKIY